jgi:hypothetical protein
MPKDAGRHLRLIALVGALVLLFGCETRSISNSGYGAGHGTNPFYRGELTEFDVLGIDLDKPVSEAEIGRELDRHQAVALRRGDTLLLLQSGAPIPDDSMTHALALYFAVTPFSGVPVSSLGSASAPLRTASVAPSGDARVGSNYALTLRLAAARGGAETIVCYWGLLESGIENHVTKAISWVPIVGAVIPDQSQRMRIRLKVAVIDVRTGNWSMFAPEAYGDTALSAQLNRGASDQEQVALLKDQAYKATAEQLVTKYTR